MPTRRLVNIIMDELSLSATSSDIDHERKVAIHDLLHDNRFALVGVDHDGPFVLHLSERDGRLVFDIRDESGGAIAAHHLSMSPLRRLIKDYFMLCETYYDAIRGAMPERLETVDMARRAVHNEGTELLIGRLAGKVEMDFDTGRRLFTLICSVSMRASHRGAV